MDGIVLGLGDERGRSLFGWMDFGIRREVLLGEGQVARVEDYRKVGTATELVGGIDGIVEALVVVRAEGGGEMGSRRKAEDADAMRVDVPVRGMGANDAEGALRILKGGCGFWVRPGVRHAVFQQHAGDADGVEPIADFGAFEVDGETPVAASGKNDNGGAGVVLVGV